MRVWGFILLVLVFVSLIGFADAARCDPDTCEFEDMPGGGENFCDTNPCHTQVNCPGDFSNPQSPVCCEITGANPIWYCSAGLTAGGGAFVMNVISCTASNEWDLRFGSSELYTFTCGNVDPSSLMYPAFEVTLSGGPGGTYKLRNSGSCYPGSESGCGPIGSDFSNSQGTDRQNVVPGTYSVSSQYLRWAMFVHEVGYSTTQTDPGTVVWQSGTVNPSTTSATEICDDPSANDEDCDGDSNCMDSDCAGHASCANCDQDGDGYIAESCGGDDCDDNNPNRHRGHAENTAAMCSNGIDDDCDSAVDCVGGGDPDCNSAGFCGSEQCGNGIDDDLDGDVDCDDSDCVSSSFCLNCGDGICNDAPATCTQDCQVCAADEHNQGSWHQANWNAYGANSGTNDPATNCCRNADQCAWNTGGSDCKSAGEVFYSNARICGPPQSGGPAAGEPQNYIYSCENSRVGQTFVVGASRYECCDVSGSYEFHLEGTNCGVVTSGSCGANAKVYTYTETSWQDSTGLGFCSAGTPPSPLPSWPSAGGTVAWTCSGVGGGTNAACQSTHEVAVYEGSPTTDFSSLRTLDFTRTDMACDTASGCASKTVTETTCYGLGQTNGWCCNQDQWICGSDVPKGNPAWFLCGPTEVGNYKNSLCCADVPGTGWRFVDSGHAEYSQCAGAPVCGDGTVEAPEECEDDSDCSGTDVCSGSCNCVPAGVPVCGDGTVEAPEECEDDSDCSGTETCQGCSCTDSCASASCGTDGDGCCPLGCTPAQDSDCTTCTQDSDCPDPAGSCYIPDCSGGTCGSQYTSCFGTPANCDNPPDSYSWWSRWCINSPGCGSSYSTINCGVGQACIPSPVSCHTCDADGDGYAYSGAPANCLQLFNAGDCNDNDANVYPGAQEDLMGVPVCRDGKDNNCPGDGPAPASTYQERDYDGNDGAGGYPEHGDPACPVGVSDLKINGVSGYVALDTEVECTSNLIVRCDANIGDIRSVELDSDGLSCAPLGWDGSSYEWSCAVPPDTDRGVGQYTLNCFVNTLESYAILGQETRSVDLDVFCVTDVEGTITADASSDLIGVSEGDPVAGAVVRLGSHASAPSISSGDYVVPNVPIGTYEPVVTANLYLTETFEEPPFVVPSSPDPTSGADFAISPEECTESCALYGACQYNTCLGQNNCNLDSFSGAEQSEIRNLCQDADSGSVFQMADGRFVRCCGSGTEIMDASRVQTQLNIESCTDSFIPVTRLVEHNGRVQRLVVMSYDKCE